MVSGSALFSAMINADASAFGLSGAKPSHTTRSTRHFRARIRREHSFDRTSVPSPTKRAMKPCSAAPRTGGHHSRQSVRNRCTAHLARIAPPAPAHAAQCAGRPRCCGLSRDRAGREDSRVRQGFVARPKQGIRRTRRADLFARRRRIQPTGACITRIFTPNHGANHFPTMWPAARPSG